VHRSTDCSAIWAFRRTSIYGRPMPGRSILTANCCWASNWEDKYALANADKNLKVRHRLRGMGSRRHGAFVGVVGMAEER